MQKPRILMLIIFLGLAPAAIPLQAQSQTKAAPCSQEELMTIKGKWVKEPADFTITGQSYTAPQRHEMDLRMDNAFELVRAAWPDPKGMQVKWGHSFGFTVPGRSGTIGYNMGAGVFHFYCNPDLQHLGVDDETDGGVDVHFNTFGGLLYFDTSMHVGRYYVTLMPARVGKLKDVDLYQTSLVRANQQFIIIARDGQFPLTMLTRKQYLISLKGKLQREEDRGIANELKYAKNDQQKSQVLPYWHSHYDPKLKLINDYLAGASEEDLAQPAYVKNLQEFTRFFTEKEGGCAPAISNANYFSPQQTPYFPQFMVVVWGWNDGEGPSGGLLRPHAPDLNVCCRVDKFFKESMEQNLDPDAFRQMLDK
jgi:hypothetical protein